MPRRDAGQTVEVATQNDVRKIALSLPDTVEADDRFAFSVLNGRKPKGFVWVWQERIRQFFTEPHYNTFPAVLVRLAAVGKAELRELLTEAWRTQAPKALLKEFDK
jgi:hypothetical protein